MRGLIAACAIWRHFASETLDTASSSSIHAFEFFKNQPASRAAGKIGVDEESRFFSS